MHTEREPNERSVSNEADDSDVESSKADGQVDDANSTGKPGRKKNPNSRAARRDQNRIAQREFRLRKQQRIRDLEARVEILSGGQDEAIGEMRNILKDLMAENQTLRGLLKSLATFIGEGVGGVLPKLGWDISGFNQFVNKSETDTAWEGYQMRKKKATEEVAPTSKRPADDDLSALRVKKARMNETDGDRGQDAFSLLLPMSTPSVSSNGMYPSPSRSSAEGVGASSQPFLASSSASYQHHFLPAVNLSVETPLGPISYPSSTSPFSISQNISEQVPNHHPSAENLDDNDPNKSEAYKLIYYHLDNFKRNNQYCLPASLRPTWIQKSIPHESVIDGIVHSELRDRMILLRNRYDLVECMLDYRRAVTIHGDDVLAHTNWEIGESFVRQYGYLIDKSTLGVTNRWRRERGEPDLCMSAGGEQPSPADSRG